MSLPGMEVIEPVINFHKIKYDVLSKLIKESDMEGDKINIFINLDSILDLFYNDKMVPLVSSLIHYENIILTAEIINLIAHYRHFFWTRFRSPSHFYLYRCNIKPKWQCSKNTDYLSYLDLKRDVENPMYGTMNQVFESNLNLVDLISTYVKGAYFIQSDGIEPSTIPYYLIKEKCNNKDECNLILTSDKMEYDLTNLDNTFILRARGNKSKIISKKQIYDHKFKNIKYRPKNELSPELYPLLMAMNGYKNRNLNNIQGLTFVKSIKILDSLIEKGDLKNGRVKGFIGDKFRDCLNTEQIEQLEKNFKCTNLDYAYKLLKEIDIIRIDKKLKDKYDNMSIMNLNAQYFTDNNLQLVELCDGIDVW